ncbi:NUDIX hydrolase [Pseudogemmobacter humi]|uniref:Mutator protein MutT4 n=1 Tax=Pseudogemmobacter humi TaxID=2483812 RepID=A0A3P5X8M1_9RHOB|nr:NUDIX hydrolase [Pseudogemmobacter humi]VDC30797.1 Putative mutator protein MutT4 [Pseudogemmobacter humi]
MSDRPLPRLAVLAVTLHEDHALLVRRRNPPDAGLWGYPGGKVRYGETVAEAAIRELREETGVRGEAMGQLGTLDLILRDDLGAVSHHYYLVAIACRWLAGDPVAADDAAAAAWIPFAEVLDQSLALSEDVDTLLHEAIRFAGTEM